MNFDGEEITKSHSLGAFSEKKKMNSIKRKTVKKKSNEVKSSSRIIRKIKAINIKECTRLWRLKKKQEFKLLPLSEQTAIRENRRTKRKEYRVKCKERFGYSCAANAKIAEFRRLVNSGKATVAQQEMIEEQRRRERVSKEKGRRRQKECLKQKTLTFPKQKPLPH